MKQDSIMRYIEDRGLKVRPPNPAAVAAYERGMKRMQEQLKIDQRQQAVLRERARRIVLF